MADHAVAPARADGAAAGRQGLLHRIWGGWRRVAAKIGAVQARALLILFYFTVAPVFAVVLRATSDPLALRTTTLKGWKRRPDRGDSGTSLDSARRQYEF